MNADQQQMIEDCENRDTQLTEWEQSFIDSIGRQEALTQKQAETLDKIWEMVTENG